MFQSHAYSNIDFQILSQFLYFSMFTTTLTFKSYPNSYIFFYEVVFEKMDAFIFLNL